MIKIIALTIQTPTPMSKHLKQIDRRLARVVRVFAFELFVPKHLAK